MISSECRNRKPYALPVQCLPVKGLKDKEVRAIVDAVIQEMVKRNMKVSGKCIYKLHTIVVIFHHLSYMHVRIIQKDRLLMGNLTVYVGTAVLVHLQSSNCEQRVEHNTKRKGIRQ